MSNFLAVATVTATMRRILQEVVSTDVTGAVVTTVDPDNEAALPQTGVNIYLYRALANPALRNDDVPTRRSDGSLMVLPEAAIELYYLFSFYGDDSQLETQRLLGSVIRTLHTRPIIGRDEIDDTLADPTYSFLAGSDLSDAAEPVRLTPQALTPQELSDLWSGIFVQTPYALSCVFLASPVKLTAEDDLPQPALPVAERQLLVQPFRQPTIDVVQSVDGLREPVLVGGDILIKGERLSADQVDVRIAGLEFTADIDDVSDKQVSFTLDSPNVDPADLRAGVAGVQVLHPFLIGDPPEERAGVESNVAPVIIRPDISNLAVTNLTGSGSDPVSADISLDVSPPVAPRQRVSLLLNSVAGTSPAQAYSVPADARSSVLTSLTFPVADIAQGDYLVRLLVDGADSPLERDDDPMSSTFGEYTGPQVDLNLP